IALLQLLQALIHADAVLHVHYIVAHREVAEVRHEGGGLRLLPQWAFDHDLGIVEQVASAKDHEMRFRQNHTVRYRSANDRSGRQIPGEVRRLIKIGLAAWSGCARTKPE